MISGQVGHRTIKQHNQVMLEFNCVTDGRDNLGTSQARHTERLSFLASAKVGHIGTPAVHRSVHLMTKAVVGVG